MSTSSSFASEPTDVAKDYQLEQKFLKDDLLVGEQLASSSEEDIYDDFYQDVKALQVSKQFQASTKYVSIANQSEATKEEIQRVAENTKTQLQYLQTSTHANVNVTSVAARIRKLRFMQAKLQNEAVPNLSYKLYQQAQQLAGADYQAEMTSRQLNATQQSQILIKTPYQKQNGADANLGSPALKINESPDVADVINAINAGDVKFDIFNNQTSPSRINLTEHVFDKTLIYPVDHSLLDTPEALSSDNRLQKIATFSGTDLVMFVTHFEAMQSEANAVAWGRVIVTPASAEENINPADLLNPHKHTTQDACVFISGIQREYYALPDEPLELASTEQLADVNAWNTVFEQNGEFYQVRRVYVDNIRPEGYNYEKCERLVAALKTYLQATISISPSLLQIQPVWRVYHFNDAAIPRYPRVWLRIRYPAGYQQLIPASFVAGTGGQFVRLMGASSRPLELFLAQKQIKAATWVTFTGVGVKAYTARIQRIQQYEVDGYSCFKEKLYQDIIATRTQQNKSRTLSELKQSFRSTAYHEFVLDLTQPGTAISTQKYQENPIPCLSAAFISVRKIYNVDAYEPLIVTLTYVQRVSLVYNLPDYQTSSYTFVFARALRNQRTFKTQTMQMSLEQIGFEERERDGSVNVKIVAVDKEVQLYHELFLVLGRLNPDVIVCDYLYEEFGNIFKRMAQLQWQFVEDDMLRYVCKLTTSGMNGWPFQSKSYDYKALVRSFFRGHVLIDLQKEIYEFTPDDKQTTVEYTLQTLTDYELQLTPSFQLPQIYQGSQRFVKELLPELLQENFAIMKICRELNVLSLTCKIAQLTCYQWNLVLQVGRAKRVENLLLHYFATLPFVLPDEQQFSEEDDSKKAKYTGGRVLEPVAGLYDSVIAVLDFNSLYPSLIREYELCFTTVPPGVEEESCTTQVGTLRQFMFSRQLPTVIGSLIEQRQAVKKLMREKSAKIRGANLASRPLLEQELHYLEIQQLALKLCANSMYGSLGYRRSRFYCPHVASSITYLGRNELWAAATAAEQQKYKVIYGDTDSIMIDTGKQFTQLSYALHGAQNPSSMARGQIESLTKEVVKIADSISAHVGDGKRFLEMSLDYIFVKQLLLAKKKYAALKINASQAIQIEVRGLDMVRRDWCDASRELSKAALNALMWHGKADAVEMVICLCQEFKTLLETRAPQVPLAGFKMTKSLSKPLADYIKQKQTDLPHVRVAKMLQDRGQTIVPGQIIEYLVVSPAVMQRRQLLELKQGGQEAPNEAYKDGYKQGQTTADYCIPYEDYQRLYRSAHPATVLDMDYYLQSQILPPLARLCSFIPELSIYQLGSALGVDVRQAPEIVQSTRNTLAQDMRDVYASCAPFVYACSCGCLRTWPESQIEADVALSVNLDEPSKGWRKVPDKSDALLSFDDFLKVPCTYCNAPVTEARVIVSLRRQLRYYRALYYSLEHFCSNPKCPGHAAPRDIVARQRGPPSMEFEAVYRAAFSATGVSECLIEHCTGEIAPVYSATQYRAQLQFFSDLFNPDCVFYKSDKSRLTDGYDVFKRLFDFVQEYLDYYEVMFVNLSAAFQSIEW